MRICKFIILNVTCLLLLGGVVASQAQSLGIFEKSIDVGDPVSKGAANLVAEQAYQIKGAGSNMWFDRDEMHFLYREVQGDFCISGSFEWQSPGHNAHRKMGWTARRSLDPGAAMINLTVHGDGLTSIQFRRRDGGETEEIKIGNIHAKHLKLARQDTVFTVYTRGETTDAAPVDLALDLPKDLLVGTYVCSHEDSIVEEALVENVAFNPMPMHSSTSDLDALRWRNIGPANMMGRIASIDAKEDNHRHVLVGTASGGVYQSHNAGMTWDVIFDDYGASSIGSAVMHQKNPNILWVGTGESANRNSSGWGNGIFKSSDGGKSFSCMGLQEGHNVAAIALHPEDPDHVYAAVVGHLWGYSGIRGLYETQDGGLTWNKLSGGLPTDSKTGCTEIVMHPENPNVLFAGFYHRIRQPATFQSGGEQGGLYKSEDGGKSWRKIETGLAEGPSGMIDISIHRADPQIMVMAYEAEEALNLVKDSLGNAVAGSGVYRSDDGGESWQFLLPHTVRPFYHGQICIDPVDPQNIYVVSRGFKESHDGGKTFQDRKARADGGDDHDMWISPVDNRYMYIATDQGFRFSNDGGGSWLSYNNMAIGQYYAIGVDMRQPYHVGGGLQDNGLWVASSNSRNPAGILNRDNYWIGEGDGFHVQIDPEDWRTVYMVNHVGFCARINIESRAYQYITPTPETIVNFRDFVDHDYPETRNVYTIDPGEHWFFYERLERPLLPPQFRFNWSSPLVMSPSNPHTIYFGGNHLFKSTDQGNTWRIISPDLTTNDPDLRNTSHGGGLTFSNTGGENHFTIITIAESPLDPAIVWAGTDDGNVQVTTDGGTHWSNSKSAFPGLPEKIWVSRVEASHHHRGTAYVTFDNHRHDDFKAYVYKTDDFGKTWQDISSNLPDDYSLYVIKEDPVNADLLFVGSESTVYTSLDQGKRWLPLNANLPSVAIHDLVIHPREGDLVAGTHGRSIWILDDLSALRQWSSVHDQHVKLFQPRPTIQWQRVRIGRTQPAFEFSGENPPSGAILDVFVEEALEGSTIQVMVKNIEGEIVDSIAQKAMPGLNRIVWDMNVAPSLREIRETKAELVRACAVLTQRIQKTEDVQVIEKVQADLRATDSISEINKLRGKLVKDYPGYAEGESLFARKLMKRQVPPGSYRIEAVVEGHSSMSTLEVLADPLLR
ncbi:MAG: hypothetical protein KTR24_05140 [Saprospiraceae bacterium]|nr:hypothetical protein [Saprospiraceae bacterium]